MDFRVDIQGVEELCKYIDGMPTQSIKRAISKGLVAGAQPIFKAIENRTPVNYSGIGGAIKPGALKKGLLTDVAIRQDGTGGSLTIGFKKSVAFVARFIEFGHRIVGHKPLKKDTGKTFSPRPFVRPALSASQDEALTEFTEAVRQSLDSER